MGNTASIADDDTPVTIMSMLMVVDTSKSKRYQQAVVGTWAKDSNVRIEPVNIPDAEIGNLRDIADQIESDFQADLIAAGLNTTVTVTFQTLFGVSAVEALLIGTVFVGADETEMSGEQRLEKVYETFFEASSGAASFICNPKAIQRREPNQDPTIQTIANAYARDRVKCASKGSRISRRAARRLKYVGGAAVGAAVGGAGTATGLYFAKR
jgi:hypothetical protein